MLRGRRTQKVKGTSDHTRRSDPDSLQIHQQKQARSNKTDTSKLINLSSLTTIVWHNPTYTFCFICTWFFVLQLAHRLGQIVYLCCWSYSDLCTCILEVLQEIYVNLFIECLSQGPNASTPDALDAVDKSKRLLRRIRTQYAKWRPLHRSLRQAKHINKPCSTKKVAFMTPWIEETLTSRMKSSNTKGADMKQQRIRM